MTTRVTLQSLLDGRVVVDKQSLTGDITNRKREAEWLASARDPGVVQLVGVTEDPFTIRTAHAGTTTLRTARPGPKAAARLLASTSNTLANLHERNLAHGNLTMDHIIVSGDTKTALCSPSGTAIHPTIDLNGVALIVTELLERWDSEEAEVANRAEWAGLAERLRGESPAFTARRANKAFQRLSQDGSESTRRETRPKPRPSAKWLAWTGAIGILLGAIASWYSLIRSPTAAASAESVVEFNVNGDLYGVGRPGDIAVAVQARCEGQPEAVLLDRNSVVWIFQVAGDGVRAEALAQVRGATNLTTSSEGGCGQIWATGPAGRTLVVGTG